MTPLDWFGVAALIVSAIAGGVSAYSNYKSVEETNATNIESAEKLNAEAWARDDTSFQRAKADAIAAGFSPLAAVQNQGFNTAPILSQANAPQLDLSGVMGALGSTANFMGEKSRNDETKRHNVEQEKQAKRELFKEWVKIKEDKSKLIKTLKSQDKKLLFESWNKTESERERDSFNGYREICRNMGGLVLPTEKYTKWEEYLKAWADFNEQAGTINEMYGQSIGFNVNSQGSSTTDSSGGGLLSGSYNSTEGKSNNYTYNEKWRWAKLINKWQKGESGYNADTPDGAMDINKPKIRTFKVPVYVGNYKTKL